MKPLEFPLLTDENVQSSVVAWLRDSGLDVRTIFDEGLNARSDAEILAHAHAQTRVVLTHDSDFGRLAIFRREPCSGSSFFAQAIETPTSRLARSAPSKSARST